MRKILMIAPTPFFADRGCHVRIYEEIKAIQAQGCRVLLCTYHNGRDVDGVETERIINVPWYTKLEAGPSWQKPFLDILLLLKVFRVALRFKPHLIHAHLHEGAFIGYFLKLFLRLPLLFDYQGSLTGEMVDHGSFKRKGFFFSLFRFIEGLLDKSADLIIPSSSGAVETLITEFGINKNKIIPLIDGVDTDIFKPGREKKGLRKKLNIPEDKKVIAYLGLLNKYQGIDLLLESIPKIVALDSQVHFLLMGYPDVEKYRQHVSSLGMQDYVTFTGKINYDEAPMYLCLGDIALSAKLSKTEANGKIFNYMACGLPTVCFDTPVNREILGDTGIYAVYGDADDLAAAITGLLADPEKLDLFRNKVRKRAVDELSWQASGEKVIAIYDDLMGQK